MTATGEKKDKKRPKEAKVKEEPQDEAGEKPKKRVKRGNKNVSEVELIDEISKKEEDMVGSKQEELKEEIKEPTDSFENHAQRLIEDVHNDEHLLANLKHLMERSDLNEIIMSLDFVNDFMLRV